MSHRDRPGLFKSESGHLLGHTIKSRQECQDSGRMVRIIMLVAPSEAIVEVRIAARWERVRGRRLQAEERLREKTPYGLPSEGVIAVQPCRECIDLPRQRRSDELLGVKRNFELDRVTELVLLAQGWRQVKGEDHDSKAAASAQKQ